MTFNCRQTCDNVHWNFQWTLSYVENLVMIWPVVSVLQRVENGFVDNRSVGTCVFTSWLVYWNCSVGQVVRYDEETVSLRSSAGIQAREEPQHIAVQTATIKFHETGEVPLWWSWDQVDTRIHGVFFTAKAIVWWYLCLRLRLSCRLSGWQFTLNRSEISWKKNIYSVDYRQTIAREKNKTFFGLQQYKCW